MFDELMHKCDLECKDLRQHSPQKAKGPSTQSGEAWGNLPRAS